jgi:hypothetical protein
MTQKNKLIAFVLCGIGLLVLPLILQQFGNAWVRIADIALLYVMLALGLNIVVGYAGLLDLGYVAFFAVGAYMYGLLASPHLTSNFAAWRPMFPDGLHSLDVAGDPTGAGAGGAGGRAAGRAHAQAARRLPGHRHAGLRRDHAHLPEQPGPPGQHHQRPQGLSARSTRSRSSGWTWARRWTSAASRSPRSRCTTTCSWCWW